MDNRIRVMVVDDSALVRKVLSEIIDSDPALCVVAQAHDPVFAMQKLESAKPDVITLDVEMPRMDGLAFLQKLMKDNPIPVVMCSSLTVAGADTTLKALQYGAVEIITKPKIGVKGFLEESAIQIIDAVKAAAQSRARLRRRDPDKLDRSPKLTADAVIQKQVRAMSETTEKVIAIGASTGGTQALREVMTAMPGGSPAILIVQHMPAAFTAAFAQNLDSISAMEVREARNNDRLRSGLALLAPGGKHMLLRRSGAQYYVEIVDGPLVNRHRPSVDVLFRSVARYAGANAAGCLMTGMGDDGAMGLKEMREAGAHTFAQDEASSVVFGMPQIAWKIGAAEAQISLHEIPRTLLTACTSNH